MGKQDDAQFLSKLKNKRFKRVGQLLIEEKEYLEMKAEICPGCGQKKKDPQIYFGEEFCGKCVQDFDPRGYYQDIKNLKGFKVQLK